MPDNLSPENRRKAMKAIKSKGTSPERSLWAMLAGMRLKGWRKNAQDLPGKPDVVFDKEKVAIFIDGCFWHGCPICNRGVPENNREYWVRKIERNQQRAREVTMALQKAGWVVLRFWEHEMRRERNTIREKIRREIILRRNAP
ncbi:MAG TPA: very short patch repair endonuclease [Chloroflexi bacterium]|nr:very short patch repair endonuclease [Chloroflexota bacterium]